MQKIAAYYKIDLNLVDRFQTEVMDEKSGEVEKLDTLTRFVYIALGHKMKRNSAQSGCTYQDIRKFTGIASDLTIRKCLMKLERFGFIAKQNSKGQAGNFLLNFGLFYGLKNRDKASTSTPSVEVTSTPSVEPHAPTHAGACINISPINTTKRQQPNTVVVDLKKWIEKGSSFKKVSDQVWGELIEKYGKESVIEKLTELEEQYRGKKITRPIGLLSAALRKKWEMAELDRKKAEQRRIYHSFDWDKALSKPTPEKPKRGKSSAEIWDLVCQNYSAERIEELNNASRQFFKESYTAFLYNSNDEKQSIVNWIRMTGFDVLKENKGKLMGLSVK